eukprot:518446_1
MITFFVYYLSESHLINSKLNEIYVISNGDSPVEVSTVASEFSVYQTFANEFGFYFSEGKRKSILCISTSSSKSSDKSSKRLSYNELQKPQQKATSHATRNRPSTTSLPSHLGSPLHYLQHISQNKTEELTIEPWESNYELKVLNVHEESDNKTKEIEVYDNIQENVPCVCGNTLTKYKSAKSLYNGIAYCDICKKIIEYNHKC